MQQIQPHPHDRIIPEFSEFDAFEDLVSQSVGIDEIREIGRSRPLRIKLGIDPTSANIHLGRSLPLWRLRAFQELGHEIHFVIGDATGQVGDTSDKDSERPMLSSETVSENMKAYEAQLWWILNPEKSDQVHIHYNSSWLSKLSFQALSELADAFSVNDFIKREVISKRLDSGLRVSLREQLYPLMQGYDSVALEADIELGGSDQWFNLLAGRTLQERCGQKPQAVITNHLISGTDGRKMSSSFGNVITITEQAFEMYVSVLQANDNVLPELVAVLPSSIRPWSFGVMPEGHPLEMKKELARLVVTLYHGFAAAEGAQLRWEKERDNEIAHDIPTISVNGRTAVALLVEEGFASSNTEARRLIDQRGVSLSGVLVSDHHAVLGEGLLRVGKHRHITLKV